MNQRDGRDPPSEGTGLPRQGLGSRSVVWGAFGLSAAIHVVIVVAYPIFFPAIVPDVVLIPITAPSVTPEGIEVLRLVEVDVVPELEAPAEPEEIEDVEAEADIARQDFSERPTIELPRPGRTAAERLRPNLTDRRLFAPLPGSFRELTLEQRERLAIAGRLSDWYDSTAAAAAAAARWTDWTFTDGDGDRWGISDGQLHLGGLTLPLPTFDPAWGPARDYMRQWDEIARQGASMRIQESVQDRIDAIRARRDRERAEQRAQDAAPDVPAEERSGEPPDTTRSGR